MIDFAWRLHPLEAEKDLMTIATDEALSGEQRNAALTALSFINNKTAAGDMVNLSKSKLHDVAEMAAYWLSFRQSNDWFALLDWDRISVNTAYERKLAQMKVKKQTILDEHQPLNERKWKVQEMAVDSIGAQLLIGMAAEKKLPLELLPFIEDQIFQNPNASIRMQAGNYFKRPGSDKIYSIQNILKMPTDRARGKQVFSTRCASCHKVANEGASIGPDLTTIGKKFDDKAMLDAIINPSAAIVFGYESWLVNTKDGESLYGFLISQNRHSIVIKDIAGQKHVIDVKNISSRKKQYKSLMPDPASNDLTEQNLADVTRFLKGQAGKADAN